MCSDAHRQLGFTDSLQHILKQIPLRALDRGLGLSIADHASIAMLALWSVLLWEHKVGLIALEQAGVERFNLVRDLDRLLREKQSELPDVRDGQYTFQHGEHQRVVVGNTGETYHYWDSEALLEPLLRQAEHEVQELGHNYVGSEHLVLAIVQLADPTLTTLLHQHGVSHGKVRGAVVRLLRPQS